MAAPTTSGQHIDLTEERGAHNYAPVPVVIRSGQGVWVEDVEGRSYLDMLSGYSALNFGHSNPRLISAAQRQLERLALTSRAFYHDQMGPFCAELADLCGKESVLPMNTGAEAVETAVKLARKWGYEVKGVSADRAEIICFTGNFHGRTTTIVSFSDSEKSRAGFGPFTPGFKLVEFGDISKLEAVMTDNVVAVLIEPIQGEGGVIIPPPGYLEKVRELCGRFGALLMADEIQTGLCRTGKIFACEHEKIVPDVFIIGKSLGGGIMPVSAISADRKIMDVMKPGTHGSTFGGNPLACAIAREVIALIRDERPHLRAMEMGALLADGLRSMKGRTVQEVRSRGLMIGVDINPEAGPAKLFCKKLADQGILCKDTRDQTIRFTPPLVIEREQLDWALPKIRSVLQAQE